MNLSDAQPLADMFLKRLEPICLRVEAVGGYKRQKSEIHDLEFLLIQKPGHPAPEFGKPKEVYKTHLDKLLADMEQDGVLRKAVNPADGDRLKRREIRMGVNSVIGFNVEFFIVTPNTWGLQNLIRTGPSWFSHRAVTNQNVIAVQKDMKAPGFLPNDLRYIKGKDLASGESCIKRGEEIIPLPEESDVFDLIFGKWIPPQDRARYAESS